MNAENISIAVGLVDDDIIEEPDTLRSALPNTKRSALHSAKRSALHSAENTKSFKKSHWKQWTVMAACLCLVVGAATVFLQGFPILGANSGSYPGVIIDGSYYYRDIFNYYRYTAGEKERLMSTFSMRYADYNVNDYGFYYIKGRTLYVREHETGKSRMLYTADDGSSTHIVFSHFADGQIIINLLPSYRDNNPLVWVDSISGEVVCQETVTTNEWAAVLRSGNTRDEYPIGNTVYRQILRGDTATNNWYYELLRDGEVFLSGTEYDGFDLRYYGNNLLISYCESEGIPGDEGVKNILITPDGETVTIRNGRFLDGTDGYLFYIGDDEPDYNNPLPVYCYDVKTGDSIFLAHVKDAYEVVTDGEWFFVTAPWRNGTTDCWRILCDADGKPIGLELFEADI